MHNRIPLELPNRKFDDVFDYWQKMQMEKAKQAQFQQQQQRLQEQFAQNKELERGKMDELKAYHQQRLAQSNQTKLTGVPAEIEGLHELEKKYGADSPQYKLAMRSIESTIGGREQLANMRKDPDRFASPQQKNINNFETQLRNDHPDFNDDQIRQAADAYLKGEEEVNGEKLPPLSSQANAIRQDIYKKNSTPALQNQAANLNNTLNEFEQFDMKPLKAYTGAKGLVKFNYQKLNPSKRTQEWYDYDAFKNSAQIYAMDTLRKGFGTSVVPGYVYETLGKMSNPVDPIWGDPKQVDTRWNKTKELIRKATKNTIKQAQSGATTSLSEKKSSSNQKYTDAQLEKFAQEARDAGVSEEKIAQKMAQLKGEM